MVSIAQNLTCLFVIGCSCYVSAEIISVPADYNTIQRAIESTEGGDQIVVAPGTYGESIAFRGKAITVRSAKGAKVTTIDGSIQFQPTVRFEDNETEFAILDGFTIENTSSDGIRIEDGCPEHCSTDIDNNGVVNVVDVLAVMSS